MVYSGLQRYTALVYSGIQWYTVALVYSGLQWYTVYTAGLQRYTAPRMVTLYTRYTANVPPLWGQQGGGKGQWS